MSLVHRRAAIALALLACAGCDDDPSAMPTPEPIPIPIYTTPVDALQDAYRTRSISRFESLFHLDFWYFEDAVEERFAICREQWNCAHRRLFDPANMPPGVAGIAISISQATPFAERPEYYQSEANPDGLDSARWRVWAAVAHIQILFETQGETDYLVDSQANFVIAEDRSKAAGDAGKLTFYRIEAPPPPDSEPSATDPATAQVEPRGLGSILRMYTEGCPACPIRHATVSSLRLRPRMRSVDHGEQLCEARGPIGIAPAATITKKVPSTRPAASAVAPTASASRRADGISYPSATNPDTKASQTAVRIRAM